MTEHPILFSGEMVRAILDGRKTQTRRVCVHLYDGAWCLDPDDDDEDKQKLIEACPYGVAGNRLWVRETFAVESNFNLDSEERYPPPFSDGRPIRRVEDDEFGQYWEQCHYRATDPPPYLVDTNTNDECGWKPSIHMPRWASRITLEIVNVRVEHVQEITGHDVIAEGVEFPDSETAEDAPKRWDNFKNLWNSINEKRGYGWDKNQWVWVIEFKKVTP